MEPEQYGWEVTLKYSLPGYSYPLSYDHQVSVEGCPTAAEAETAVKTVLAHLWPEATSVETVSVETVWSPDFRKHNKSGLWEQRDRADMDGTSEREPWNPIPGKPAIPLKRLESYAGWTYYMPKPSK